SETRRAVEGRMLDRRQVTQKPDVVGPWKLARVQRSANHKTLMGSLPGGFQKKLFQSGLAIWRISTEVGQGRVVTRIGRHGLMEFRIYGSVERGHSARSQAFFQAIESSAAGITENQIEGFKAVRRDVVYCTGFSIVFESDGRVEVVKHAHRTVS